MKKRIARIIEYENLSSTMFAERLGISKAVVSHILNGRNNPSLDVVSRIMQTMPYINSEWLINGEGEMLKPGHIDEMMNKSSALFYQEGNKTTQDTVIDEIIDRIDVEYQSNPTHSIENKEIGVRVERLKRIKEIIIYYDDNTFETFYSE